MIENFRQLDRLQKAKATFDVTKMDLQENKRQKLLANMKLYPEAPIPISEIVKRPPMSKKQFRRQGTVVPNGNVSPRGGKLPNLQPRGFSPSSRAFRSVLPPQRDSRQRLNSQQM